VCGAGRPASFAGECEGLSHRSLPSELGLGHALCEQPARKRALRPLAFERDSGMQFLWLS